MHLFSLISGYPPYPETLLKCLEFHFLMTTDIGYPNQLGTILHPNRYKDKKVSKMKIGMHISHQEIA